MRRSWCGPETLRSLGEAGATTRPGAFRPKDTALTARGLQTPKRANVCSPKTRLQAPNSGRQSASKKLPVDARRDRHPDRLVPLRQKKADAGNHSAAARCWRVAAANAPPFFTILHNPAQNTLLRPHVLRGHASGHDRTTRARTRPCGLYRASSRPSLCALHRPSGKGAQAARRDNPTERAKRILHTYTVEGGRKTIRSSHSRLCSSDGPTP